MFHVTPNFRVVLACRYRRLAPSHSPLLHVLDCLDMILRFCVCQDTVAATPVHRIAIEWSVRIARMVTMRHLKRLTIVRRQDLHF